VAAGIVVISVLLFFRHDDLLHHNRDLTRRMFTECSLQLA
jgi:hypothetical protein